MASQKNTSFDVYRNLQSLYDVKALPYIPIPIEEINEYTKLQDYTEDRIKNINTIGTLESISPSQMILSSTQDNGKGKIILDTKNLYDDYNFLGPGSDPYKCDIKVARVFGTLELQGEETVILVHHFSPVEDVECSERVLRLMAQVARQRISAYRYDVKTNPEIQHLRAAEKGRTKKKK